MSSSQSYGSIRSDVCRFGGCADEVAAIGWMVAIDECESQGGESSNVPIDSTSWSPSLQDVHARQSLSFFLIFKGKKNIKEGPYLFFKFL